jgi:hypothetical protein
MTFQTSTIKLFKNLNPQKRRKIDDFSSCDVTVDVTQVRVVYQLTRLDVAHNIYTNKFHQKKFLRIFFEKTSKKRRFCDVRDKRYTRDTPKTSQHPAQKYPSF